MKTVVPAVLTMLLLAGAGETVAEGAAGSASPVSAISGVVRDTQGVAQMGVRVQVLAAEAALPAVAFTDARGRYTVANLLPGTYFVQASAALFRPATRGNLQLRVGTRAVVNLTLSTMLDATTWLPAERRRGDEPSDDWKWTLRSSANRPILRMLEDGDLVMVSSSAMERPQATVQGRGAVTSGDGGFGGGGAHSVVSANQVMGDGSDVLLRADVGQSRVPFVRGPSNEVEVGFERRLGFAGAARTVVSYKSHPEMVGPGGVAGMESIALATAQQTRFGDLLDVDYGGVVYGVHAGGSGILTRPFVRVSMKPGAGWTLGYRMATARDLQGFDGLDAVESGLPVAVTAGRGIATEQGRHQEFWAGNKLGRGVVQIAVYKDAIGRAGLSGTGALQAQDLAAGGVGAGMGAVGVMADTATDSFRLLADGYTNEGVSVMLSEPITPGLWAAVQWNTGSALTTRCGSAERLQDTLAGMRAEKSESATVALKGVVVHTGTKVRASYRWQPSRTVTAVDPFAAFGDQSYLSFYLRQPVRFAGVLPAGLEAIVDVTNLMSQGYQPFLSADGRTLYLAQTPRTLQAGLAFTF